MVGQINNRKVLPIFKYILSILLLASLQACGQIGNHQHQTINRMEYQKINNYKVKAAIEAWQDGNSKLWLSFFTTDVKLLDDGNLRDFKEFSTEALGHERFTTIDKAEDNGLSVYGHFHSDTWGDFKTYFKFHLDAEGKFNKLEIGQAHY
ncbi:hypothetical protein SAMN05444267_100334 [Chryseobacterium polytrichastri]|uniref:DUF4440 domain-containing protein n=1 Tax=Chryseobacterium polytrichastri TaxID=1302687 RepID=A0A1M6RMC3_9FLAO|nr:hypothetical protein SAMN05444267_100334 [Chryseobacterium polytrichastri]